MRPEPARPSKISTQRSAHLLALGVTRAARADVMAAAAAARPAEECSGLWMGMPANLIEEGTDGVTALNARAVPVCISSRSERLTDLMGW